MSAVTRLQAVLDGAIAEGLLPAEATLPAQDHRPWPVVLLMALGAWLAALPLLGVIGLLFGQVLLNGAAGPYIVGVLLLAAALVVLRGEGVPLFVEQLAVPALLLGLLSLGFVFFRDLSGAMAALLMGLLLLAIGWVVKRAWMRVPLGAAAAVLLVLVVSPHDAPWRDGVWLRYGLAWQAGVGLWVALLALQQRVLSGPVQAGAAAAVEALAAGWLLACLGGLAWWSGATFLVGGAVGGPVGELGRIADGARAAQARLPLLQGLSVALALGALLRLRLAWPGVRRPVWLVAALVPVALAAFMPALGALLLALAVCAASGRWRLAAAAGVAAAWVVGAFYYQLAWPLAHKALVLALAGAGLLVLMGWQLRGRWKAEAADTAPADARIGRIGLIASAALVAAVANVGIWQKERLIAQGTPVFVELAPADPRSLMQGDFMTLRFRLGADVGDVGLLSTPRPRVVARRDGRGVATILRLHAESTPTAPDELLIELTPKNGHWTLVTDAWFFREGEAARWSAARYGEFRVAPDGRALLLALRGAQLEPL